MVVMMPTEWNEGGRETKPGQVEGVSDPLWEVTMHLGDKAGDMTQHSADLTCRRNEGYASLHVSLEGDHFDIQCKSSINETGQGWDINSAKPQAVVTQWLSRLPHTAPPQLTTACELGQATSPTQASVPSVENEG